MEMKQPKSAPMKSPRPAPRPGYIERSGTKIANMAKEPATKRTDPGARGEALQKMDKAMKQAPFLNGQGLGTVRDKLNAAGQTRAGATARKKMIDNAQMRKGK
jgi:hypothetical protein